MSKHQKLSISNGVLSELRRRLSFDILSDLQNLPEEQRTELTAVSRILAKDMGLCSGESEALALVSTDMTLIENVIKTLRDREGQTYLAVAILLFIVISKKLYMVLYGHQTVAAYFRDIDTRIGLYPSKARFLYKIGEAFVEHGPELMGSLPGLPGYELSELATRHLSKLSYYLPVRASHGAKVALEYLGTDTFAQFKARIPTQEHLNPPAEKATENGETKRDFAFTHPDLDETMAKFSDLQIGTIRIVQRKAHPYLAISKDPKGLEGLEEKLDGHRRKDAMDKGDEIGHDGYDPTNPLKLCDELILSTSNVYDVEERIRTGIAMAASDRRTISFLVARLEGEEVFRQQWQKTYKSFKLYAAERLGIHEELRDYLRVGRNLLKYPLFNLGAYAPDSDVSFYSLRYLDSAMRTHKGDASLIGARIRSLTYREFAEFAIDPNFERRRASKRLTYAQEETLNSFFSEIDTRLAQGYSVKVVEVYNDHEISIVESIVRKNQNAAAADDVVELSTGVKDPQWDQIPAEMIDALVDELLNEVDEEVPHPETHRRYFQRSTKEVDDTGSANQPAA